MIRSMSIPRLHASFCRALAAAVSLALYAGAALAAPAGSVVGLFGACFIEHGGGRVAAAIGQAVEVSDTVDVPAGGKLKLRMADGSVVSVAAGSRVTVTAYGVDAAGQRQNARLMLAQGLVRAEVAPVARPASFEVDTAVGTAAVRSTDWFVEASARSMQVGVLTGNVQMTSAATGRGEAIPARWGARLDAGRDPVPPRLWSKAEFAAVIARTNVPEAATSGICQCIAEHDRRHIGCLSSVDQCKAACGEHYSFVPHAPSCPITAQGHGI
jgi:hypothetical protein